jgi:hypothetical protein
VHLHGDVQRVAEREVAFRAESPEVKAEVRALLDQRFAKYSGGFLSAALSPLVAVAIAIATVITTFALASYTGLNEALVKLTDPATGLVHGMTRAQLSDSVRLIVQPLFYVGLFAVVAGWGVIAFSRSQDRKRAVAYAWIKVFQEQSVISRNGERSATRHRRSGR